MKFKTEDKYMSINKGLTDFGMLDYNMLGIINDSLIQVLVGRRLSKILKKDKD